MAAKKPEFEQSLARLEEIVRHLEKGDLPLSESLCLFEAEGGQAEEGPGQGADRIRF